MKSIKWLAVAGMMSLMVACGGVSDGDMLKDLEDDEVTELCSEICEDSESYELMCGEGDNMITYSSDGSASDCESSCGMVKNVKDSCTVTAGDLRTANSKPANCDEAAEGFAASLKLVSCF